MTNKGYALIDSSDVIPGVMYKLATVTGINAKTIATTTLYTVPTGRSMIVDQVILRNTTLTLLTPGTDELTDPGLEAWTANTLDSYDEQAFVTGTLTKETIEFHGGSFAAKITTVALNDGFLIGQGLTGKTPGTRYEATAYAKNTLGNSLVLVFLNDVWASATQIWNYTNDVWEAWAQTEPTSDQAPGISTTDTYTQWSSDSYSSGTGPTVAANGKIYCYYGTLKGAEGGILYLDDLTLNTSGLDISLGGCLGGNATSYDDFTTWSGGKGNGLVDGITEYLPYEFGGMMGAGYKIYTTGQEFKLNITTGAITDTETIAADVFGYLL